MPNTEGSARKHEDVVSGTNRPTTSEHRRKQTLDLMDDIATLNKRATNYLDNARVAMFYSCLLTPKEWREDAIKNLQHILREVSGKIHRINNLEQKEG